MMTIKLPTVELHIGQQLKKRREELKLKQSELANMLGITPQQLSKYENGIDWIPTSRLYKLCKILAITPNFFFEGLEDVSFSFTEKGMWLSAENMIGQKVQIEVADLQGTIINIKVGQETP